MSTHANTAENRITIADGLTVGRIGYGAMKLTGPQVWGEYPDHDKAVAVTDTRVFCTTGKTMGC